MKRPLLYIIAAFFLLQSCILTRGVNISQVYTDKYGRDVSVDRKFVQTVDTLTGNSRKYRVEEWAKLMIKKR